MSLEEILRKLIWTVRYYKKLTAELKAETFSPSQLHRLEYLIKESKELVDLEFVEPGSMGVED